MADYNARHMIEALRSGVPSREVGAYFSESRPGMTQKIQSRIEDVRNNKKSDGMLITGRYGEGKTHMLHMVFQHATATNMVVSYVSLGKETPIDRPYLLYRKLMANTYLPGAAQPGFRQKLEAMTQGSGVSGEMLAYAAKNLETDKLYFLLKAFLGTQEEEERFAFLSDLEGDFASMALIKRSYRRVTGTPAKPNQTFSKTKHCMDYFYFMSHLFQQWGYDGWVILLDEAELLGRFGKKTRAKSYVRLMDFLHPSPQMEGVFTLGAFSASYVEDVIDKKNEIANAEEAFSDDEEMQKKAKEGINRIISAPELVPLTTDEISHVLMSIQKLHGQAYDWHPDVSVAAIRKATEAGGYLLRTQIRAAIEFFDQLYQYGEAGATKITELGKETFEEDVPELFE